jgi:hypothetical protein
LSAWARAEMAHRRPPHRSPRHPERRSSQRTGLREDARVPFQVKMDQLREHFVPDKLKAGPLITRGCWCRQSESSTLQSESSTPAGRHCKNVCVIFGRFGIYKLQAMFNGCAVARLSDVNSHSARSLSKQTVGWACWRGQFKLQRKSDLIPGASRP